MKPNVPRVPAKRGRRRIRIRWRNVALVAAGLFLIAVGLACYAFYSFLSGFQDVESREFGLPVPEPGQRVNVLVLGIDLPQDPVTGEILDVDFRQAKFWPRSDTIMVVSVDPETREVGVISIPRDTRVKIAWDAKGYEKINHAHAYGGPRMAVKTVENFLEIPIHYYVRTDPRGFAAVVDILGGIELEVEKDMYYEDPYQDLVIDLKKGRQVLDGHMAMQYTRYRSDSDIARVLRQQKFLEALKRELFQFGTILKLPKLAGELLKHVDTNMAASDILNYAVIAARITAVELNMATIPGEDRWIGGVAYWMPDLDGTRVLVDRLIWGIEPEENALIRVEVLNGTDNAGLASKLAASLQDRGFAVVRIANAPENGIQTTQVINLASDEDKLRRVVGVMGRELDELQLLRITRPGGEADVRVVVGQDYYRRINGE